MDISSPKLYYFHGKLYSFLFIQFIKYINKFPLQIEKFPLNPALIVNNNIC